MIRLAPFLLLLLAGCAAYIPVPDALMAGGDDARLSELRTGRDLYIDKCSGCHSLIPVDRYEGERWTREVDEMLKLKKVRLADHDRTLLLNYLGTASKVPRS